MKQKKITLTIVLGIVSMLTLSFTFNPLEKKEFTNLVRGGDCPITQITRYSGGINAYTGSAPDGASYTCLNCHGGGSVTPTVNMTVSPAFTNNTYVPGQTYQITYNVSGYNYFGFDFEINDGNSTNSTTAGTFSNPSSNCIIHPSSQYPSNVGHSQRISSSNSATFTWTAPTNATNSLYLFSVGLGVNGNGNTSGDNMVSHNLVLTPASTPPTSSFTTQSNSTTYCANTSIQLINNSTNATSYNWTSTGGVFSSTTSSNPTVVFANSGNYTVTLTANNNGLSNTYSQTFTIVPEPVSQFTPSTTNTTLPNATVSFSNQSTNATSYLWDFGDGNTSTATSPSHTYTSAGTFTVTLTSSNAYCSGNSSTSTITVTNNNTSTVPVSSFSTQGSTSFCEGSSVSFTNNSINATSYLWDFGDGNTSATTNPSHIYTVAGTYVVTLTASSSGGSNNSTQTITVVAPPTAQFSPSATNLVLPNATVTFTNNSLNSTTYLWDFGDGNTSTFFGPTHTYTSAGSYTVTLTANNSSCPSVSTSQIITVSSSGTSPVAQFSTQSPNNTFCVGEFIYLTNNSINATSYNWNIAGGSPSSSTAQSPVVVFSSPGTYTITLIANGNGNSNVMSLPITIIGAPTASFTYTPSVDSVNTPIQFTNTSLNSNSFLWDFGDGNTSTQTNPTHTYTSTGTYQVVLNSSNNTCPNDSVIENITVLNNGLSSIDENELFSTLKIFPNPVTDVIQLSFSLTKLNSIKVYLLNMNGQKIKTLFSETNMAKGEQQISIPIDKSISSGIYFIQVETENKSMVKRILVK